MSPKNPTPGNSSELEEMLNERDGRLGEVMRAYIAEQTELIRAQLRAEQQVTVAEMLQGKPAGGTGAVSPAAMAGGLDPDWDEFYETAGREASLVRAANAGMPRARIAKRNKLFNKQALGAQLDSEPFAKSIGGFLQAIWHRAEEMHPEDLDRIQGFRRAMRNALSERVPSQGGFLVPEVLRSQILMVALENAVVRPRARIVPMDSLRVPYPTIDDTSHTANVFGGVTGYWTEEASALTASQPSFGRIVLEAKKLTGYTLIPNELLNDAVQALDQWFRDMFPIALAWFEDVAFIAGSGSGQPQGFQNSPCAVVTGGGAAGIRAGGAGTAVQYADLAAMYARLLPMSLNNAVWLASPDVIPGLLQLVTASGIAPPLWLPNFSAADGFPGGGNGDGFNYRIMGRPLVISEKMPALASQGCLALVDFGYYLLGDRQSMLISSSEHVQFANDLTAFRVIERLDGRTWIQSPITPENGGNTLSPVVLLHS